MLSVKRHSFCFGRIKDSCLYIPKGILPDSHKDWGSNTDVGNEYLFRELKTVHDNLPLDLQMPSSQQSLA